MQGTVRYVNVSYSDIGPLTIGIRTKDESKNNVSRVWRRSIWMEHINQSQTFIKIVKQFS